MILRRVLALIVLIGAAIGSALYWNDWRLDATTIAVNLMVAGIGFVYLHHKWKDREARAMTPKKAKDIFS